MSGIVDVEAGRGGMQENTERSAQVLIAVLGEKEFQIVQLRVSNMALAAQIEEMKAGMTAELEESQRIINELTRQRDTLIQEREKQFIAAELMEAPTHEILAVPEPEPEAEHQRRAKKAA